MVVETWIAGVCIIMTFLVTRLFAEHRIMRLEAEVEYLETLLQIHGILPDGRKNGNS